MVILITGGREDSQFSGFTACSMSVAELTLNPIQSIVVRHYVSPAPADSQRQAWRGFRYCIVNTGLHSPPNHLSTQHIKPPQGRNSSSLHISSASLFPTVWKGVHLMGFSISAASREMIWTGRTSSEMCTLDFLLEIVQLAHFQVIPTNGAQRTTSLRRLWPVVLWSNRNHPFNSSAFGHLGNSPTSCSGAQGPNLSYFPRASPSLPLFSQM